VAWSAGRAATRLAPAVRRWINRLLGAMLIAIGARLALLDR